LVGDIPRELLGANEDRPFEFRPGFDSNYEQAEEEIREEERNFNNKTKNNTIFDFGNDDTDSEYSYDPEEDDDKSLSFTDTNQVPINEDPIFHREEEREQQQQVMPPSRQPPAGRAALHQDPALKAALNPIIASFDVNDPRYGQFGQKHTRKCYGVRTHIPPSVDPTTFHYKVTGGGMTLAVCGTRIQSDYDDTYPVGQEGENTTDVFSKQF
jgi:hypothetical protein